MRMKLALERVFYGIRMVQDRFQKMTLFKKEIKSFTKVEEEKYIRKSKYFIS